MRIESDDSMTEIVLECQKGQSELSLDCLDHGYFKLEIAKLLRQCYEIELSRFKQRNAKGTPSEWRALTRIKSRLELMKRDNENFVRFEPQRMLDEVYEMNGELDLIKCGVWQGEEKVEERYEDENDYEEDYEDY
jgi:hypothetical protein